MIIELSLAAEDDLLDIWEYLADHSHTSAELVIEPINETIGLLARNPKLGLLRPELNPDVRSFGSGNAYIIFYKCLGDVLFVARVLHQRRSLQKIFGIQ